MAVVGAVLVRKAARFVPVSGMASMCFSSQAPCQAREQLQDFYIPSKNMETGEIYGVLAYIMDGIFWLIDAVPLD